ncbi:MAG: DUF4065 domain-containing protein [Clostridiales bacterium]|nr:DUF4065 domain-containing protein [Clostridiales bacterium]
MENKPSIFDCARRIALRNGRMTALKLQKLAYYCQAWSLAWDDAPLFEEDFQAWANGPVCPELFQRHKGAYWVDGGFLGDLREYPYGRAQDETIKAVLDYYGGMEPYDLSELTHKERPWRETRSGVAPGDPCDRVIPKSLMQEYYGGL